MLGMADFERAGSRVVDSRSAERRASSSGVRLGRRAGDRLDMAAISSALLERDPSFSISDVSAAMVGGRRVAVTGAAGSIGTELVRQLSRLGADVVMLDIDESRLHGLQLELSGSGLLDDDTVLLADIRDGRRLRRLFDDVRPEVVFHAAAHKHLPLLERYPAEAVKTNVVGTRNVAEAALAAGTDRFVLISTDKAAEPTSVLGASKLLAERIVQSLAGRGMDIASVRFGNVLGSRGSLLDTLTWQLNNGLPVTVTHPDVTRFFMSIPEAVSLVLDAASMATDGETYVLDMGQPMRIVDVVVRYAALLGEPLTGLQFSGLRPGEKLHEVLAASGEQQLPTPHPRISMIPAGGLTADLARLVERLEQAATDDDDALVRDLLRSAVTCTVRAQTLDEPRALTAVG
jgi:FlaA1/EpsC-like NDP-sugar epimerase